jgi:hypothetical protein
MSIPTRAVTTLAAVIATASATLIVPATDAAALRHVQPQRPAAQNAQVVLDWERISFRTVYTDAATPIPVGVPVLGFTSLAMYDATEASLDRDNSSETAAVATAAHDVLAHYYPALRPRLDGDLAASMVTETDSHERAKGQRIGSRAADEMLKSRAGDGWMDTSIHYSKAPGVGVWQPVAPATDMLAAWLGSLRPLAVTGLVEVDGPDALDSPAYTADYNEVKAVGSLSSTTRTQAQTDTARFFNSNSATMVGDALVRHLETHPIGLRRTAQLFAAIHVGMTNSVITTWQLKRDVGLWRPFQAVAGADTDGNPDTSAEPGWQPLLPNPAYSDYVSGHAALTGPAVQVVRTLLGEETQLELRSTSFPDAPRTYPTMTALEHDAFHARIWGGLHFRDAMDDGYLIGHRSAERALVALSCR